MMRHDLKPVIIRSEKFISFKEYERECQNYAQSLKTRVSSKYFGNY